MNIDKVDFFKIDIEGAEYEVFKSMTDWDILHIDGFMVEIHWNKDGRIYEITDRLQSLGYEIELRRHTQDNAVVENRDEWKDYDLCTFYAWKSEVKEGDAHWKSEDISEVIEDAESESINLHIHHLRTTLNTDVEKESMNNIRELADYLRGTVGFHKVILTEYENEPYTDIPPRENCARPDAVSLRPFPNGVNEFGQTALTPAHYGCFDSFKKAFLNRDISNHKSIDYDIFFEGDAFVDDFSMFANCLLDVHRMLNDGEDIGYVSFGGIHHLETGEVLSHPSCEIAGVEWGYFSEHIPFAHCVIIPFWNMENMRNAFEQEPWDVADLFLMNHFRNNPSEKQFVSKHQIARQLNGFSLIDKKVKVYQHK